MTDSYFRPTLLVGVGGTGCAVAERVFLEARRNNVHEKERIGVLVFDTDIKALLELKSVPKDALVQFSTPDTVETLLNYNPDANDWFYEGADRSVPLLNMNAMQGAGQIRMITRLALHNSFRNKGTIEKCKKAIAKIAVNDGTTAFTGLVNILVVGSLAGATGSGSFYQIALVLRQLCQQSGITPNIMGLFLMPDIYISSGKIKGMETDNVMVNAYASLKELNAINVVTRDPGAGADFKYSYMPDHYLREGQSPFSAVTLMDFEASRGGNMGPNLDNYVDLATRAGYLLIFSPLGPSFDSVAVNQIQETITRLFDGKHNLFAGLGVSTLNYPALSMRDHLAYKLVLSKLDNNWIRLDDLYRTRVRRFVELKSAGQASAEEPKLEETYLRDLEEMGDQQKLPFFRDIWKELHPEIIERPDRPGVPTSIAKTYVDAFLTEVDDSFWRSAAAKVIKGRQPLDAASLKTPAEITEAVNEGEKTLNSDLDLIDRLLKSEPDTIYKIALTSAEDLSEGEWRDSHIQKWMIRGGPHPVRNRAFLYQVRRIILDRLAGLNPKRVREKLFDLSNNHAGAFAEKDSGRTKEKPSQRANSAIQDNADRIVNGGGLLAAISGRIGGNKRSELVESYVLYYGKSLDTMRDYANVQLQKSVLEELIKRIEGLIKTYVGLFGEIEGIGKATRVLVESEANANGAAGGGTDGNIRAYADKACREAAWKRVEVQTMSTGATADVNKALNHAIHDAYRVSVEKNTEVAFNDLGALFREHVVEGFAVRTITDNYASEWDITVIEAVKREAEVRGISDWVAHLEDRIRLVSAQAEPYISITPDTAGQGLKFWALHPDAKEDFGSDDLFTRLTATDFGGQSLVASSFARQSLFCVNFRLNLSLDQLSKLADGDENYMTVNGKRPGPYKLAYSRRIEEKIAAEINQGKSGTGTGLLSPHAHRDWHRPGALPEINPEKGRAIRASSIKAAVVSIHFGLLEKLILDKRATTRFSTLNKMSTKVAPVNKPVAETHDLADVVPIFLRMTDIVRVAEQYWTACKESVGMGRKGTPDILAVLGSAEKVAAILEISADRTRLKPLDDLVVDLMSGWCQLVNEGVTAVHKGLSYDARKDMVAEITSQAREAALERLGRQYSPELLYQFQTSYDTAIGQVLSEI
jgi:hypothetical protein